jgi:hypothetical protein
MCRSCRTYAPRSRTSTRAFSLDQGRRGSQIQCTGCEQFACACNLSVPSSAFSAAFYAGNVAAISTYKYIKRAVGCEPLLALQWSIASIGYLVMTLTRAQADLVVQLGSARPFPSRSGVFASAHCLAAAGGRWPGAVEVDSDAGRLRGPRGTNARHAVIRNVEPAVPPRQRLEVLRCL